ncbi:hypothetical protein JCM1841_005350 [Sporobolomyces salmonicolor]
MAAYAQGQHHGSFDASWEDALTASASFDSFDGSLLDIFGGEPSRGLSTSHSHHHNNPQEIFAGQQTAAPRGMVNGAMGSDRSVVAHSDTSSPQGGNLSYSSVYSAVSTAATSHTGGLDFDLESMLARSGSGAGSAASGAPSPPFSFATADPAAFVCDFDTTALQSLFANSSSTQQGVHQTVSPAATTFTSAAMLHPGEPSSDFSFLNPAQAPSYPQAYPQQPAFLAQPQSQRYGDVRRASVSSAHALSPTSQHLHPHMQPLAPPEEADPKRRRISLAETAGLPRPQPIAPSSNAAAAPMAFTLNPDVFSQLVSVGMTGRAGTAPVQRQGGQGQRQRSPVELIANAGMLNGVYRAPVYQQVSPPPQLQNAPPGGKGTTKTSAPAASQAPVTDDKAGGGKRKKGTERGHNAVEQKYRNSINNALATLRDTIPALRHLKPLPSMPVTKRKASQFTLPSGASTATPVGLVDGVTAAKTLSKGVILNKAIEYIDFLRFTREAHHEDLELFKEMVTSMVGDGERLVEEFERRREAKEKERIEQREAAREREEGEDDEENGDEEDDQEEEEKTISVAASGKKAAASAAAGGAGARKRAKKDQPAAPAKSMAASAATTSPISLPSQQISPPLTAEYRHVQARNAAHLESLTGQQQYFAQQRMGSNPFPPSPVSSDELSVSPSAIMGDGTYRPHASYPAYSAQPPRVLLASFMGLSFAGGLGWDWTASASAAAEGATGVVGKAWTSRLMRRAARGVDAEPGGGGALVDLLHPSLLSGLVALGVASIVVSVVYLVYPLFSSAASSSTTASSGDRRRRDRALSSLAAASSSSPARDSEPQTHGTSRTAALQARRDLLALAGAPPALLVLPALLKETLVWALGVGLGLSWAGGVRKGDPEMVEKAVAWVRVAEIEATVGDDLSHLSRIYTFLRLSNLSRSPSWPEITPSTARPAVTALLATHLLSLGHPRWAESLWTHMLSQRKKADSASASASSSNAADSFIDLALSADFDSVRLILFPSPRPAKAETDPASPSDTVPLLLIAESTCLEALLDVWTQLFTAVVGTTCPPHLADADSLAASQKTLETLVERAEIEETLEIVLKASDVEGSEVRTLALLTAAFVGCLFVPGRSDELARTKPHIAHLLVEARRRGPFARLAAAAPWCQLLLPASAERAIDLAALPKLSAPPANEVDLLATTTLAWLLVRRQGLSLAREPEEPEPDEKRATATNPALHAQALEVRRLLAHEGFRDVDAAELRERDGSHKLEVDEAKELLVDALTAVARRAAGLGASPEDDSGVEF